MRLLPLLLTLLPLALTHPLTIHLPSTLPPLPPSTHATLTTKNHTLRAPLTRANTFIFRSTDLILPFTYNNNSGKKVESISYLLDIACRDYDFVSYGLDVARDGKMEVYRVLRGGIEVGGREVVGEGGVEVRVLRGREFYEARAGCKYILICVGVDRWERGGELWCSSILGHCYSWVIQKLTYDYSLTPRSPQKPDDPNRGSRIGVCDRDAISHGQQYVPTPPPPPLFPPLNPSLCSAIFSYNNQY